MLNEMYNQRIFENLKISRFEKIIIKSRIKLDKMKYLFILLYIDTLFRCRNGKKMAKPKVGTRKK